MIFKISSNMIFTRLVLNQHGAVYLTILWLVGTTCAPNFEAIFHQVVVKTRSMFDPWRDAVLYNNKKKASLASTEIHQTSEFHLVGHFVLWDAELFSPHTFNFWPMRNQDRIVGKDKLWGTVYYMVVLFRVWDAKHRSYGVSASGSRQKLWYNTFCYLISMYRFSFEKYFKALSHLKKMFDS